MSGFTEAHRDHVSKLNALNAKRNAETKEKNIKAISEYLMNLTGGATVKEICVDTHFSSELIRRALKELVESGEVVVLGKEGKSVLYGWHKGEAAPIPKEEVDKLMPVDIGGKEFTEVKPAVYVNQGELVWCSSRSGDGAFFLYLVLTPWEKKATVIGTFPEGHPCLNLNDSRNVYLKKVKVGDKMVTYYANLDNVCSRAYAQFGESEGRVDDSVMSEVKARLRRYYRIPLTDNDAAISEAVAAASRGVKDLKDTNKRLSTENDGLKIKVKQVMIDRDTKVNGMQTIVDNLADELTAKSEQVNTLLKSLDEARETAGKALQDKDKAEKEKNDYGIQLDQAIKDLGDLEAENDKLKKQLAAKNEQHAESFVNADDLLYYIAQLECRIEGKDALIAQQKETIEMLKGFVSSRLRI